MTRVYIGNLASSVTSDDLLALFSQAGEVRGALAVSDKTSGLCRGFGFVDMVDVSDAVAAMQSLDRTQLNGQPIAIVQDQPRELGGVVVKAPRRRSKTYPI